MKHSIRSGNTLRNSATLIVEARHHVDTVQ
jgi:hypothetical protein